MATRCKHEDAKPSRFLDDWLWCVACRTFVKRNETR